MRGARHEAYGGNEKLMYNLIKNVNGLDTFYGIDKRRML
jgi:hypothetical protein